MLFDFSDPKVNEETLAKERLKNSVSATSVDEEHLEDL